MEQKRSGVYRKRQRKGALWTELQPWRSRYQRLSQFTLPFTGRWLADDANKANEGYNAIYDSSATDALRTLVAGLHQRASSPATPWMKLATPDPELNKYHTVKTWLEAVSDRMLRIFARSNTYRALPHYYTEMALYGTACGFVAKHPKRVIHHHPMTAGQYALATDGEDMVNVCYREFRMTIAQMVETFGRDRVSPGVLRQYERGNFEDYRTICHAIEPRPQSERTPGKVDGVNKEWSSCYFEFEGKSSRGSASKLSDVALSEGGFDRFPILAPRWQAAGGDVYGNSPGMQVLGDVVALQQQTKRKGMAIDYKTKAATQGPRKLQEVDQRPGGHTELEGDQRIEPLFDARHLDLSDLREDLAEIRERINRGYLAFVFLLQAQNPQDITALQAQFIEQEKMTLLGPTQERIENELLKPLVDITFDAMLEAGEVPPWPDELEGMDLNVEFLSPLAQAQRAVGASVDDRVQMKVQSLMETHPEAGDLLDVDHHVRKFVDKVGGSAEQILAPEDVEKKREQRAQAQAAQAQMELMQQGTETAKTAAEAEQITGA